MSAHPYRPFENISGRNTRFEQAWIPIEDVVGLDLVLLKHCWYKNLCFVFFLSFSGRWRGGELASAAGWFGFWFWGDAKGPRLFLVFYTCIPGQRPEKPGNLVDIPSTIKAGIAVDDSEIADPQIETHSSIPKSASKSVFFPPIYTFK